MIRHRDIIIVGLQPWDIRIGSNCRNIALELSKNNRVLYVNPPLDRNTWLKNHSSADVSKRIAVVRGESESLVQISDQLYTLYPGMLAESVNWIPWKPAFNYLNRLNNIRLAGCIKDAVQKLGFKDYILFNDQSMIRCFYLKQLLKPDGFIYYIRDNLQTIPYFRKYGISMEAELMSQADAVAANSGYLAEYASQFNKNSAMVGQGCDFSIWSDDTETAAEMDAIRSKGPVIGYTGFLTSLRMDIPLLETIAMNKPQWQFVFVGPEDAAFNKSILHSCSNVYFLGNKNGDQLPSYIKGFDVAINPQLVNEVTKGNYPRKIDEYLAMGKPVVATSTPFMSYFKEHAYLGSSADEYITLIAQALKEDCRTKREARKIFARTHTWESNVRAIGELYMKACNKQQTHPLKYE
jgi:glycosyltransferase involved in cell wall biosynthesis